MKFYEVTKYLTILNYSCAPGWLMVSGDYWKSLPDDVKTILKESAEEMTDWTFDVVAPELHDQRVKELSKTMQVSTPEIEPFKKAAQPFYDDFVKSYGREWIDLIDKAR